MALREYFEFFVTTKVMYGENLAAEVGAEAEALEGTKAIIITDRGVLEAGLVEPVKKSSRRAHLSLSRSIPMSRSTPRSESARR